MLDWEENVFLGLKAVYKRLRVRPEQRRRELICASLKERRGALLLVGQIIAGRPLVIFETDKQMLCSGERIFLPKEFSVGADEVTNSALYDFKVILAALAIRGQWTQENLREKLLTVAEEFPPLIQAIEEFSDRLHPVNFWDLLGGPVVMAGSTLVRDVALTLKDREPGKEHEHVTEIEGKGQPEVEVALAKDDDGEGADMPMHTFEKVETLEEANGLSRKSDAEDELAEHKEALDELEMKHVVRSSERPNSIYRSDIILDGFGLELQEGAPSGGIPYPEWDFKARIYRKDWCHVKVDHLSRPDAVWQQKTALAQNSLIRQLKRQFAAVVSDWQKLRRQPKGNEFDLDALVQGEVDRLSGHTPSESIYVDRKRDLHDVSALILMDQSYSTDAWLENRRVLDTITGSIYCTGEVLEDYISRFAVAAFSSNTRRSCHFSIIKDFNDSWHQNRSRLGSLKPMGYTRIGPALRHAQELLERQKSSRKLIILITDGHPCDYDRYEGSHGIHDVKKAIETGLQHGISTHAFAIEKDAASYFPRMFTGHHFDIIPHPQALTKSLCHLFAKTMAG